MSETCLCRLCGSHKQSSDIVSDLNDIEDDDLHLRNYIEYYCRIKLNKEGEANGGLSTKICRVCRLQIELFVAFCDLINKVQQLSQGKIVPRATQPKSEEIPDQTVDAEEKNIKMERISLPQTPLQDPPVAKYSKGQTPLRNILQLFKDSIDLSFEQQSSFSHVTVNNLATDVSPDGEIAENWLKSFNFATWHDFEYCCVHCDAKFKSLKSLMQHFKEADVAKVVIRCDNCDIKPFSSLNSYINHVINNHHEHLGFCCIECSKLHYNIAALIKHYQKNHPGMLNIYPCIECAYYAQNFTQLRLHVMKHSVQEVTDNDDTDLEDADKDAERPSTSKAAAAKVSGEYEQRVYHPKASKSRKNGSFTDRKEYPCDKCSKVLVTYQGFLYHKRVHDNVWPFPCKQAHCKLAFRSKQARDDHMKTHK